MSTDVDDRRATMHRSDLIPVRHGDRELGAYFLAPEKITFVPAVDVTRIAMATITAATVTAVAVATAAAVRRRPAIGAVTMGPGGWVSLKSAGLPPLRDGGHRPWWARLLRAHRLVARC
ncbi:hypothetical protein [Krasilnikovia sp. MM14-A1259]|uniref:hypothetical protein n=1 Tax=Krasilnikovia sp. MM14-A1259 TaxID=3373539 RepID=UPI0038001FE2